MQYKEINMYRIFYIDERGLRECCNIYSDSNDIYSLKNLPDTTFYVELFCLTNKDNNSLFRNSYIVGTPLGVEELEKEIKITKDEHYREQLLAWQQNIEIFNTPHLIFRKQGKIVCINKYDYNGEFIGDIRSGRILKENETNNGENDDNYLSLE